MVACAGARYCVDKARTAFFARTKEAWTPSQKKKTKKRLLEDDFGPPDNTDLYDAALASGKLDELLKPIRDEQNAAAHIIGQRVKSYLWRQRELRIPVAAALKEEGGRQVLQRKGENAWPSRNKGASRRRRIAIAAVTKGRDARKKRHEDAKRALFLENRRQEVELRWRTCELRCMVAHLDCLKQYLDAVRFQRQFFSRLLRACVKNWRGFAMDSIAEKRSARLMQACWRMLQAMATVKAKRAENARKRRVFDRLFGKAMDRRLRRII